jgi:hypothetical protein
MGCGRSGKRFSKGCLDSSRASSVVRDTRGWDLINSFCCGVRFKEGSGSTAAPKAPGQDILVTCSCVFGYLVSWSGGEKDEAGVFQAGR